MPYIQQMKDNPDEILISGKKRIQILYQLNHSGLLHVQILSPEELSKIEAFRLNLFENLAVRILNDIEKSNVIKVLTQDFMISKETLQADYLPHLNLPLREETIEEYLKLQELDENEKELVALGVLKADSAVQLLKFNKNSRVLIVNLIQSLHLGLNPQKTLLKLAWEIFKKGGISFDKLMTQESFKKILDQDKWSPSQKWARLEGELKKLRFPMLSQLENEFANIKKELKLPPSLTLQNPAYFETSDYLVQFHFKNLKEYQSHVKILNDAASNKTLEQLFKLTGENDQSLST
jgi:hypothetical protein